MSFSIAGLHLLPYGRQHSKLKSESISLDSSKSSISPLILGSMPCNFVFLCLSSFFLLYAGCVQPVSLLVSLLVL
jgi:hypothetical protein